MSLLSAVTVKPKLILAKKKLTSARKSDGSKSDYMYEAANKMFEEVAGDDTYGPEAQYHWGFSLYNQAKTKTGEEAEALLVQACEKFSASVETGEQSIKPLIDWGVTQMAIAELRTADRNDALYDEAIEKFQKAEELIFGSASYNLACIYAIRHDEEACKQALEDARDNGSLPTESEVLGDPDLDNIKETQWFKDFTPTIKNPPPTRKTRKQLAEEAEAALDQSESQDESESEGESTE